MEFQEFCCNNETLRFPVRIDPLTNQRYTLMDDLLDIFPGVSRVMLDGIIVPYMVDARQQKYEPKRIPFFPGRVLQLLAPAFDATVQEQLISSPPEYTPVETQPPSYRATKNPTSSQTPPTGSTKQEVPRQRILQDAPNDLLASNFEFHHQSIPRLFVILPLPSSSSSSPLSPSSSSAIVKPYEGDKQHPELRLYFLCECTEQKWEATTLDHLPRDIHLTDHEGYEIKDWDAFLENFGTYVLGILLHLTHHLTAAPYWTSNNLVTDTQSTRATNNTTGLARESQESMLGRIQQAIAYLEQRVYSGGDGVGYVHSPSTFSHRRLNRLPSLLCIVPEEICGYALGDLYRQSANGCQVQWVCQEHRLNVASPLPLEVALIPYSRCTYDARLQRLTLYLQDSEMTKRVLRATRKFSCVLELEVIFAYPWAKSDLKHIYNAIQESPWIQSVIIDGGRSQPENTGGLRKYFTLSSSSSSPSSSTNSNTDSNASERFRYFFSTTTSTTTISSNTRPLNLRSIQQDGLQTCLTESDLRVLSVDSRNLQILHITEQVALQAQPHVLGIIQKSTQLTDLRIGSPDQPGRKIEDARITFTKETFWMVLRSLRKLERLSIHLFQIDPQPGCLAAFLAVCSNPCLRELTLVLYDCTDAFVGLGRVNLQHIETLSIQLVGTWRRGFLNEPIMSSMLEAHRVGRAIEYDLPKHGSQTLLTEKIIPLLSNNSWTHYGCNVPMDGWQDSVALLAQVEALRDMRQLRSVRLTRMPATAHYRFWEKYFSPPTAKCAPTARLWTRRLKYLVLSETNMPRSLLDNVDRVALRRLALHYCIMDTVETTLSPLSSGTSWVATFLSRLDFQYLERLLLTGSKLGEKATEAWVQRAQDYGQELKSYLYDASLSDEELYRMKTEMHRKISTVRGDKWHTLSQPILRNESCYARDEFVQLYSSYFFL